MADMPTPNTYANLRITEPDEAIWVSPVDSYETGLEMARLKGSERSGIYLILVGPTGSGKSSFIEAIASKSTRKSLGISKDQLESVTQQPCIYEIKNVKRHIDTIYIIDTPGLADPTISELQVLNKITYWRDLCQNTGYARILYFHSISDIRMPGSRKRCLDIIHNFWGMRESERAMLITSMWDRLPERSRDAAEKRFNQLSNNQWGDWITEGSSAVKFENTYESAMDILNTVCETKMYHTTYDKVSGLGAGGTASNPLYEALLDRISSLEQQRGMLMEDLARFETQNQPQLLTILTDDVKKTELLLKEFKLQMEQHLTRFGSAQEGQTSHLLTLDVAGSAPTDGMDLGAPHLLDPVKVLSPHKRFIRWVDKKVNGLNSGRFSRK